MEQIGLSRLVSMVWAGSLIITAIFASSLSMAPSATADSKVVTVETGSGNLNLRSAPTTSAQLLGTIRNGSKVVITCYVRGAVFVGGPFSGPSDIWNRRHGGGFITDKLLDTGSDGPVVPPCAGADATADYRPAGAPITPVGNSAFH